MNYYVPSVPGPRDARSRRSRSGARWSTVYLPVGSLEWHSVQNPLGTDRLKAHAICCEAALRYGGMVLPTLFLGILGDSRGWGPEGWSGFTVTAHDQASMEETLYRVARGLVANGADAPSDKVLVGVTGHDVESQRDALHADGVHPHGIQRAGRGSDAKGFGVMEGENWSGGTSMKYRMDHVGAWETSAMLFAHEDRVRLRMGFIRDELGEQMEASGRTDVETMQGDASSHKEPEGIGCWNPSGRFVRLKYASPELGLKIVGFCAERIGKKAIDVLGG